MNKDNLFPIFVILLLSVSFVIADEPDSYLDLVTEPNTITSFSNTLQITADTPTIPTPNNPSQANFDITNAGDYVNLFTGSASYSYKLELPRGINNFNPVLSLNYNHHNGKSPITSISPGWSLTSNYIYRDTKHTRSDTSDDKLMLHFAGSTDELVYLASEDRYHTKHESFLYIKKISSGPGTKNSYWIIKTKDGTVYRLGYNQDSELLSNQESYTVEWLLDTITDTHGNTITYTYIDDHDKSTVYLDKINYGTSEIDFIYDDRFTDSPVLYSNGRKIRQSKRLDKIDIKNNNVLVRAYDLSYIAVEYNEQISEITMIGIDGTSKLPSIKFDYSKPISNNLIRQTNYDTPVEIMSDPSRDDGVRLLDINADGFLDLAMMKDTNQLDYWLNTKDGWSSKNVQTLFDKGFTDAEGRDRGVRFVDVNDDGKQDIVQLLSGEETSRKVFIYTDTGFEMLTNHGIPSEVVFTNIVDESYDQEVKVCNTCGPACGCGSSADEDYDCDLNTEKCDWRCKYYRCISPCRGDVCRKSQCGGCNGQKKYVDIDCDMSCHMETVHHEVINHKDTGYRFIDVNGDGKTDIVKGLIGDRKTWIKKDGTWNVDNIWIIPEDAEFIDTDTLSRGVTFADVNGDGKVDIIRSKDGNRKTWINTGKAWQHDIDWVLPIDLITAGDQRKLGFVDIDNDGYTDLFDGEREYIWLNTKHGWQARQDWIVNTELSDGIDRFFTKIGDINGDAAIEFVRLPFTFQSTNKAFVNENGKAYLLSKVTNQLGGSIEFDYSPINLYDNTGIDSLNDIPFGGLVVNSVDIDNGLDGDQGITASYDYSYIGGFYNIDKKEFRGFGQVIEDLPDNTKVIHQYHQDQAKTGMEYSTKVLDTQDNPFILTLTEFISEFKDGYHIVEPSSVKKYTYDGVLSNPRITEVEFDYDEYGNVVKTTNFGDISVSGDEKFEYMTHQYNTDKWILNTVTDKRLLDSDDSTQLRQTLLSYNDFGDVTSEEHVLDSGTNPVVAYSYDTHGNLRLETDPRSHSTEYQYDPTNVYVTKIVNALGHETLYGYDFVTGNLLSVTDPNGFKVEYDYDVFGRKIKEILPYDSPQSPSTIIRYNFDGISPEITIVDTKESNSEVHSSHIIVDGLGNKIREIYEAEDNKHIINDIYYDSNGRLSSIANPIFTTNTISDRGEHGPSQSKSNIGCSGPAVCASSGYTQLRARDSVIADFTTGVDIRFFTPESVESSSLRWYNVYTSCDYPGRVYAFDWNSGGFSHIASADDCFEVNEGEYTVLNNRLGPNNFKLEGSQVRVRIKWLLDGTGNERWRLNNAKIGFSSSTQILGELSASPQTMQHYDQLNRITSITNADGTSIDLTYDHWTETIQDENNNIKDYVKDAHDNIIEVKEYNTDGVYSTEYDYDGAGNLNKITDNQNNVMEYTYDSLGRKIIMNNPDMGEWHYVYDVVGNLIRQTDSIGNSIDLTYDDLDRVTTKTTQDGIISYAYDQNTIGTLSSITTPDSVEQYDYDHRLRGISEEITIDGLSFTTSFVYDAMDRVISKTLPDGQNIRLGYNDGDSIESIIGIVDKIDYNEAGQPVKRRYVNSLDTDLSYDPTNLRLTKIKTGTKQDLEYDYDNTGNVIEITDNINSKDDSFTYDSLDRLILARSTTNTVSDISYTYDSVGNLLRVIAPNFDLTYDYSTGPVHAPSKVLPPNTAPRIIDITQNDVDEGGIVVITINAVDDESDQLQYSINNNDFIQNDNVFTWQTENNDIGVHVFTLTVSDDNLDDSEQVVIKVNVPNTPPIIQPINNINAIQHEEIEFSVEATDIDDLTYSINNNEFNIQDNQFDWIAKPGDHTYTVSVSDNQDISTTDVDINVIPTHCNTITCESYCDGNTHFAATCYDNVIFRTNSFGNYMPNEWIALDIGNGLKGYVYQSLIKVTDCHNRKEIFTTPEGYNIYTHQNGFILDLLDNCNKLLYYIASSDPNIIINPSQIYEFTLANRELVRGCEHRKNKFSQSCIDSDNIAPSVEIDDVTINEGEDVVIEVLASDYENNQLQYTINDNRFTQSNNIFTWITNYQDSGVFSFIVTVIDKIAGVTHHETEKHVTVEVKDLPCATITCPTYCDGTTRHYNGRCSTETCDYSVQYDSPDCGFINTNPLIKPINDIIVVENSIAEFTVEPLEDDVSIIVDEIFSTTDNTFTWQTDYDDEGVHEFEIIASKKDRIDSKIVKVTVTNNNRPARMTGPRFITLIEDTSSVVSLFTDADNDFLRFGISGPNFNVINDGNNNMLITPTKDYFGISTPTMLASDDDVTTGGHATIEVINTPEITSHVNEDYQYHTDDTIDFRFNVNDILPIDKCNLIIDSNIVDTVNNPDKAQKATITNDDGTTEKEFRIGVQGSSISKSFNNVNTIDGLELNLGFYAEHPENDDLDVIINGNKVHTITKKDVESACGRNNKCMVTILFDNPITINGDAMITLDTRYHMWSHFRIGIDTDTNLGSSTNLWHGNVNGEYIIHLITSSDTINFQQQLDRGDYSWYGECTNQDNQYKKTPTYSLNVANSAPELPDLTWQTTPGMLVIHCTTTDADNDIISYSLYYKNLDSGDWNHVADESSFIMDTTTMGGDKILLRCRATDGLDSSYLVSNEFIQIPHNIVPLT